MLDKGGRNWWGWSWWVRTGMEAGRRKPWARIWTSGRKIVDILGQWLFWWKEGCWGMGPGLGGMHGKGCCCFLSERRSCILETGREIFLRSTCRKVGKETVKNTEIQIHVIFAPFMRNIKPPDCLLYRGMESVVQSWPWEWASSACAAILQKGDTPLHVAIRGRSRRLAELLLRNPKDGRLLYRPNKAGETPYNIDCSHQKSILTQIFGASK